MLTTTVSAVTHPVPSANAWNRRCELLADAAERTAAAAEWLGAADYPKTVFDTAWKRFIAHQFHDDITGTSFQVCYKRNWNDYILSQNQFAEEYRAGARAVAAQMDTSFAKGVPVVVTNPLQGTRTEAVSAKVCLPKQTRHIRVTDAAGKPVPSQIIGGKNTARISRFWRVYRRWGWRCMM